MRHAILAATAALAVLPGIAHAAEPVCLTPTEFTALSAYALPSVIRGSARKCQASLPGNAYLRTDGEKLAHKYEASKNAAWPGAKAAMLKVGAAKNADAVQIFGKMSDANLQPIVDEMIAGMIDQQLPLDRCKPIDRLFMLVSPLPAENTAELIGLAAGLGASSGKARVGQISLCQV